MRNLKLTEQRGKTVLKIDGKIAGYISKVKNGYAYNIGKPSDISVSSFTKNCDVSGFTLLEAKTRLMQVFINN